MKENTQSMALRDRMEIYIPVEAEVKSIPLRSLPNSILRRIGLPLSDPDGSKRLTDSLKGIWICPAVIRRKGQKVTSHTGNDVKEDMVSLLGRESPAETGSYRMSFVSSNRTAYKVLKDTMPGNTVSAHTSHTSLEPQGSSLQTVQDAVVIYNGQIYLSLRNPNRSQRKTHEPKLASQSFAPSTSDLSSKSQKKVLTDNKPKKKQITCKVTHSQNTKGVTPKVRDVASPMTTRSVPESTGSVHTVDGQDARAKQTTEEAAVQEPDRFEPQEEEVANNDSDECEMQDLGSEEADIIDHINDMDSNLQIDTGEVDQSCTKTWTRRGPLGAACASTSLPNECDFKELAQDEMIARMKARLKEKEAALSRLTSS